MKKTLLVIATVLALIVGTYFADKATRVKVKTNNTIMKADNPGTDLPVPELTLKDLDGNNVSLSEYKGKVILVRPLPRRDSLAHRNAAKIRTKGLCDPGYRPG
jgi:cytochrome oxidase Cu insertion factor (SCO1/SenC/PrrC family)